MSRIRRPGYFIARFLRVGAYQKISELGQPPTASRMLHFLGRVANLAVHIQIKKNVSGTSWKIWPCDLTRSLCWLNKYTPRHTGTCGAFQLLFEPVIFARECVVLFCSLGDSITLIRVDPLLKGV
jgi:hypothetical protein